MRILHVYKAYAPVVGGIENNVRDLAEAFAARGHDLTVLVCNRGWRTSVETLNGVRVVRAGQLGTLASTPVSLELVRQLRALRPDITHLHAPYPVGEAAQWMVGRGRPYVITYHAEATRPIQTLIMRAYAPIFRRVLGRARRVLVTSPNYARTSPFLAGLQERVTVVPLGADPNRFRPATGHVERPFTILFVGLLRHYKGVDDLIRAVAHLQGARLIVAGEGPGRAEWQRLAEALEAAGRVAFLGRIADQDLPALYRSADVFVLPAVNRAEAFGLVLVEAMLSGLACVTTEIGSGTSFVVQHETTGLVVPPRDPAALAGALRRLMDRPELRARLGAAGRERALSEFTLDKMIERVHNVYHSVRLKD